MGDDKLPAPRPGNSHEVSIVPEGAVRAKKTRDIVTGFFHNLGSRVARRSIEHDTAENEALEKNIDAHGGVLKGMIRLRDTVDEYEARDYLAPEHYKNAVERQRDKLEESRLERQLAAERRSQALVNA